MPTYCYRQIGTGDKRIGTFSFWVKRGNTKVVSGGQQWFWNNYGPGSFSGSTDWLGMRFTNDSELEIVTWDGNNGFIKTNAKFRDSFSWYHIVARIDTTQSTNTDRIRLYVNGEQITSVAGGATYPSQNHDYNCLGSSGAYQLVGARATGTTASPTYGEGFDGYIAQAIYCQGQSLAPTSFGSTNANGIWVPNSQPSVTYGSQGFKLDFSKTGTTANASGFGADSSGNGNHMTSAGLGTNPSTTDTCINNFATMNPINIFPNSTPIITNGNLKTQSQNTSGAGICSTIAVSTSKWYAEGKIGSGNTLAVGVVDIGNSAFNKTGTPVNSVDYNYGGGIGVNNSNAQTGVGTFTGGDIIGIALNMDTATGTVTFYKNGNAVGSPQNFTTSKPGFAAFYFQSHTSGGNQSVQWNFGNPIFTLADAAQSDANGYGKFEYAVPSGYYALCTKNLAAYGG